MFTKYKVIKVNDKKFHQCTLCHTIFKQFNQYTAHVKSFREVKLKYKCEWCCERRSSLPNYTKHLLNRHSIVKMSDKEVSSTVEKECIPLQNEMDKLDDLDTPDVEPEPPSPSSSSGEPKSQKRGLSIGLPLPHKRKPETVKEDEQKEAKMKKTTEEKDGNVKRSGWIIDLWTLDYNEMNKTSVVGDAVYDLLSGGIPTDTQQLLSIDFGKQVEDSVGQFLSLIIICTLSKQLTVNDIIQLYERTLNSSASKEIKDFTMLVTVCKCNSNLEEIIRSKIKIPGLLRKKLNYQARFVNRTVDGSWSAPIYEKVLESIHKSSTGRLLNKSCSSEKRLKLWINLYTDWKNNLGTIDSKMLKKTAKLTCFMGRGGDYVKVNICIDDDVDSLYIYRDLIESGFGEKLDGEEINLHVKMPESLDMFLALIHDEYDEEKLENVMSEDLIDMIDKLPFSLASKCNFLFRKNDITNYFKSDQKGLLFKCIVKFEKVAIHKAFVQTVINRILDCEMPNLFKFLSKEQVLYLLSEETMNLGAEVIYKCLVMWSAAVNQRFEDVQADEASSKRFESVCHVIAPSLKELSHLHGVMFSQGFVDFSSII